MTNNLARVKTAVGNALKSLLAPAEDPRETVAFAHQHQYELLLKVRQALADLAVAGERLRSKMDDAKSRLPRLQKQARDALKAGHEELARVALQRRQVALAQLKALEQQASQTESETRRLQLVEQRLSAQIEAYLARQELIAARHSAVEAQADINTSIQSVSTELSDLENMLIGVEARAAQMQAHASAIDQYVTAELSGAAGEVERLSPAAMTGGADFDAEIEAQLNALRDKAKRAGAR